MVPLTFLVLAGLSPKSTGSLVEIAIKFAGLGLFTFLVPRAGRDLFPPGDHGDWRRWATEGRLLAAAILGVSVTPLVAARVLALAPHSFTPLLALSVWPVACHAAAVALVLRQRWQAETTPQAALALLGFVGLVTFPLILVFGFTAASVQQQLGQLSEFLERLAPHVAAAAVPVIAAGLFVHRRAAPGESILPALLGT